MLVCRNIVIRWAAIGGLMPIGLFAWLAIVGFPDQHEWANKLPLWPITLAFAIPSLPSIVTTVSIGMSASGGFSDLLAVLFAIISLLINVGVYALAGAYWCRLTRDRRSRQAKL